MKILEYYNNLRKKRIVAIAALALMALVLVVTPLTALAAGSTVLTIESGNSILRRGESVTLVASGKYDEDFEINKSNFSFRVSNNGGSYYGGEYGVGNNTYSDGFRMKIVDGNKLVVTNEKCAEGVMIKIYSRIQIVGGSYFSTSSPIVLTGKAKTLAQEKMGSIFDDAATMVTAMLTFIQQFITFMTSNPILLIPLIVFLVGVAIFFLVRLLKD